MNHIARESGCWVSSSATVLETLDVPADFPGRDTLFAEESWINPGDAVVVKPSGGIEAGPMHQDTSLLVAKLDLEQVRRARNPLDVAGHYGPPDLFQLKVNRRPQPAVSFEDLE